MTEHCPGRFATPSEPGLSLVPTADDFKRYDLFVFSQAPAARRCVVSRPSRPLEAPKQQLVQPVCFSEGQADGNGEAAENRVIVITSGKGGVGKTTASANLGMSIAR